MMNRWDLEGSGHDLIEIEVRNFTEGQRKTMKDFSHDIRCPVRNSNREYPEYKYTALPIIESSIFGQLII
jgi:hypothetical protein